MESKVDKINQEIENKKNRMIEKVDMYFASIILPETKTENLPSNVERKSVPPASYILYGVSCAGLIGVIASSSKILYLAIAAISAYGGFKLSKNNKEGSTVISMN